MKCPNCNHVSTSALFKCSSCGEAYDRAALETLEHLNYVLAWLDQREQAADLRPEAHEQLRGAALKQLEAARTALRLPTVAPLVVAQPAPAPVIAPAVPAPQPPPPAPASTFPLADQGVVRALALVKATRQLIPAWTNAGIISIASAGKLGHHLATRAEELRGKLTGQTINLEPPDELRVLEFVLGSVERWADGGHIAPDEAKTLLGHLRLKRTALMQSAPLTPTPATPAPTPAAVPAPKPITAPAKPAAPPQPVMPPAPAKPAQPAAPTKPAPPAPAKPVKPPAPPIDWNKVWERAWGLVVSGALLRGLLYLGAFMIVVSAIVLAVVYWTIIPEPAQLGLIAAVPLTFYASGFFMRARLKLPEAGGVFTGIGALLVAVDFAAVYQIGGLAGLVDVNLYWLIASIFCAALYTFTAWRVRGEFFAYITLIGASSTLLAFTSMLRLPLEWRIASIAASAAGMLAVASPLKRRGRGWRDLARATHHLPLLFLPVSMFLVLLVLLVPGRPEFGQTVVFLLAAFGFGLLAFNFPAVIYAHASMWSSVGAIAFALRATALPVQWYATVAAALAPLYMLAGRALYQRLDDFTPPRNRYRGVANLAGFGLLVVAVVAGVISRIVDVWAGITALALAALVLGWCAYFFRRSTFVFVAAGLFIAPFSLAALQWLNDLQAPQAIAWLMAAGAGLALIYLTIAVLLRHADKYAMWLNFWAHALAPLAVLGLLINYAITADSWFNIPTLVALGGVIMVYAVSAVIHDSRRHPGLSNFVNWLPGNVRQEIFLWPIGLLIPVWAAIAWWGSILQRPWFGAALAGLALAYVGAGQLLALRKAAYRFPPHVYAYLLAVVGIAVALGDKLPLMTTLYIVVAVAAALALIYRRVLETAVAAALFVWPFHLALQLSPLTPHAYSLAYALLASFGYLPLGLWLDKIARKYALPSYVIGYGLAAFAVAASLLGRFGAYPRDVQWIGVIVPLIIAGQQIFSLYRFKKFPYAWVAAAVFPIAFGQALTLLHVLPEYDAVAWVGLAFAYMLIERGLVVTIDAGSLADTIRVRSQSFRWPLGLGAAALCALGLALTAYATGDTFLFRPALASYVPHILAQGLAVGFVVLAARLYHSRWPLFLEPLLAFFPVTLFFIGYGERFFGQALTPAQFGLVWSALAITQLLVAVGLDRNKVRYSHGLYVGGYALTVFAVVWTLADRGILLWTLGLGIAVAISSAALAHFNRHHSWDELIVLIFGKTESTLRSAARGAFLWLAAWPFPVWCVLLLQQLNVADGFYWLGFGVSALALLGLAVWLRRFERTYAWPLHSAAQVYTALGLLISAPLAIRWLSGQLGIPGEPFLVTRLTLTGFITLQTAAVIFYAASARVFRWRLFTLISAALAFFPLTLLFIGYSALKSTQFSLVWIGLALVHLCLAALLDRNKTRYSHGLYLAGYALAPFAIVWTALDDRLTLVWTLGLGIAIAAGSALLIHLNRHWTWDEVIDFVFGPKASRLRSTARGAFLWLAAWPFPIWCMLLLQQLNVADGFYWLGFGVSALALLGLAVWLRRFERTYAWPLNTAAQFYTAFGLLISAPLTLNWLGGGEPFAITRLTLVGFIVLQTIAVIFYAASARAFRTRLFAHIAAWLSFVPYTLVWIRFADNLTIAQFALPWVALATALLAIGFALDRQQVRYAHGPYLAGYALAGLALMWSALARDRVVNLYTLAAVVALALISHALTHYGRHRSFADFVNFLWILRKEGTVPQRAARTLFLFFAAYAVPVWLAQFMAYREVPLAWRGLGLALAAPIYIAFGLAARRVRREYTWPLYSAGYALTAIGAMVAFGDLAIAIYVLALNTVVYAVSAYLFRQPFWLYLANALVPITVLLTLAYSGVLTAPWVSGIFMALAFVYFGLGQLFNRRKTSEVLRNEVEHFGSLNPFAISFFAPGYLLSAIALAVASGEKFLAIEVYSAGVVLYALSAWAFRESVFLYPAAWLAAVPYYLGMTLAIQPGWYGLGWLPLIVGYIALGRFVFHKKPFGGLKASLTHPAMPLYLLAYPLSLSMMILSQADALTFTLALAAGAVLYFASAALFHRPAWLYPALLAAHVALMSYFTISPTGKPAQYITLPFLGMTWLVALVGYTLSRRFPVTRQAESGKLAFKFDRWGWDFGSWKFLGYLLTPSWSQPFFIFTLLDVVFWQAAALGRYETAIIVAVGFAVLFGLLAMLWLDGALTYVTFGFFLLAVGYRLSWAALPLADSFAVIGGIGFGLYLLARIIEGIRQARLDVWIKPLTNVAMLLTGLAVVATLPFILSNTTAAAFALAFAGALYLTVAYRGHYHRLGYTAMAMLQVAWALLLIVRNVAEPQLYAIPAGLYFSGVGFLERRRGRKWFALVVESFGLAVLLLTSFIQSLDGVGGFWYFVLLLVEGLLVIWWGAARRLKIPFFVGLAASALNVTAQVVVLINVYDVNRWILIFGVGILLVSAAVFVERQRVRIIARAQEWRVALEAWE